jgi:hypothetical protein
MSQHDERPGASGKGLAPLLFHTRSQQSAAQSYLRDITFGRQKASNDQASFGG